MKDTNERFVEAFNKRYKSEYFELHNGDEDDYTDAIDRFGNGTLTMKIRLPTVSFD